MTDQIKDIVIPILKQVQSDNAAIKTEVMGIREHVESLDRRMGNVERRLGVVENHMTGFMSTARYLELEMDVTRGRLESLEEDRT